MTSTSTENAHAKSSIMVDGNFSIYLAPCYNNESVANSVLRTFEQVNIRGKEDEETIPQHVFNKHITNYFVHTITPLHHIQDPYFRNMFSVLNIDKLGLNIMNEASLETHIDASYVNIRTTMKKQLKQIKHSCISTVFLSGRNWQQFVVTTCHWVGLDLKRKSCALTYRRFSNDELESWYYRHQSYKCNYDNIAGIRDLKKLVGEDFCLSERNLKRDEKRDHFYYNIQDVVVVLSDMTVTSSEIHLQSCPYLLVPIYVSHDPKSPINNIMMCCRKLWTAIKRPESSKLVQNILGKAIATPNNYWRLFYEYNFIQQILLIQDKCAEIISALELKVELKPGDFVLIREYLKCYQPIVEATDILLDNGNSFYGVKLPCLLSLRKKLIRLTNEDFVYCSHCPVQYLEILEKEFKEYFTLSTDNGLNAAIAALSHPKFKNKWYPCIDTELHDIINCAFQEAVEEVINNVDKQTAMSEDDSFFELDDDVSTQKSNAKTLIAWYLADNDTDVSMLHRHKEIQTVFIKYNTPLSIQSDAYKIFLYESVKDMQYAIQSDEIVEKIAVVKYNVNK